MCVRFAARRFAIAEGRQRSPQLKDFAGFTPEMEQAQGLVDSSAGGRGRLASYDGHELAEELFRLVVAMPVQMDMAAAVVVVTRMAVWWCAQRLAKADKGGGEMSASGERVRRASMISLNPVYLRSTTGPRLRLQQPAGRIDGERDLRLTQERACPYNSSSRQICRCKGHCRIQVLVTQTP